MISFDTETTGLRPQINHPTHVGVFDGYNFKMWDPNYFGDEDGTTNRKIIMHNGKFDRSMMYWNHHVDIKWTYDTMLLSQLYDSRVKHKLDTLGEVYIGQGKFGDKKVLQAIKKGEFWMLPVDTQTSYLRRDCELTWRLFQFFRDNLSKSLLHLYESFDLPVSLALNEIEWNGFTINEELLNEYKRNLEVKLGGVSLALQRRYGDVNFNSPKQLLEVLRTTHHVTLENTSERSLEIIARYNSDVRNILEYRELTKYLNTYIGGIEKHLWKGKVYPQYHLAGDYHSSTGRGTTTGRTSSSNPNLQNQPRNDSGPYNIRKLFRSSEKSSLLAFDYNQLELKVGAYLSGEHNLLQGDIHAEAAKVLKVDRSVAKTCNFALLYGASDSKIRWISGGSRSVDRYISWFRSSFPRVEEWCDYEETQCAETGRIETFLGRVRYMDHPEAGPNSIIQGSAGDIGKEAAMQVHKKGYHVVGLIHDEVLVEIPDGEVQNAAIEIPKIMTEGLINNGPIHKEVKLGVSVKVGKTWGEMKEYVKD